MANLGNLALTAGNRVRALLEAAERMVLAMLARSIRASRPLNSRLRRQALRILQRGLIQARTEALRQYRQAYDAAARELETLAADIGRDAAALRDALPPKLPEPSVDASAILRHMRRDVDDLFRDIQEAAVAHREETGATVGAAMQEVLDAFAESGITSFTDAGGRRWGLQEYANMVVRTGVQRAGLQATVDRMLANGWDLCFVTPHMGCCPQCAAWQGVVMSLTGKSEGYPTVQQAMDGGLFHPNCAHVLQVYIPGVSDLSLGIPKGFTRDSNAKLYTARQRQRFIERKIRQAKREQAAAFTPEAEQAAREELRRWQAAARANARGEVQRRYDRERVMRGLVPQRGLSTGAGGIVEPHDPPIFIRQLLDGEDRRMVLLQCEDEIRNAPVEHAYVITRDGRLYHCIGTLNHVYPDDLGDDLIGADVTHNHPIGSDNEYSFGSNDVRLYVVWDLRTLRGTDSLYTYQLSRIDKAVDEIPEDWANEFNFRHSMVIRDHGLYGYGYRRWHNDETRGEK